MNVPLNAREGANEGGPSTLAPSDSHTSTGDVNTRRRVGPITAEELPRSDARPLDAARVYIAHGLAVVPVCAPVGGDAANCTAKNLDAHKHEHRAGKVPTAAWKGRSATTLAEAAKWWGRENPYGPNIALLAGPRGWLAIDVDGPRGEASLAEASEVLGALPPTLENVTGRVDGGRHLLFRIPADASDDDVRSLTKSDAALRLDVEARRFVACASDDEGSGLDLRAGDVDAGRSYIIVAPSLHASGARYQWRGGPLAELPAAWWRALPRKGSRPGPVSAGATSTSGRGRHGELAGLDAEHAAGDRIASALPAAPSTSPSSPGQRSVSLAMRYAAALRAALPRELATIPADTPDSPTNDTIRDVAARVFRLALGAGEAAVASTVEAVTAAGIASGHPEAAVRATVASSLAFARAEGPAALPERERTSKPRTRKAPRASEGEASDASREWSPSREGLPVVTMSPVVADVEDAAIAALAGCEALYQRHPQGIVRTIEAPALHANATPAERSRAPEPGAPLIEACSAPFLRSHLSRVAVWRSWDGRKEGWREVAPPDWIAPAVLARRSYARSALRPLRGVIEAPTLRPDGSVLTAPGYDAATELLLHWTGAPVVVADAPTREDARASFDVLASLFADFTFQGDRGVMLAAIVAAILTPLARAAIRGAVPAFMLEANAPSAGKTLCATVCGAIVTGRPPAVRSYTVDDDEMRKTIGAIASAAPAVALFDNVRDHVEGGALEGAITAADTIAPRVLGVSATPELPWRTVLYLTANGVTYSADNIERFVHVLLAAPADEGERTFAIPELLSHAIERRAELLSHALVILRAYVAAGRPSAGSVHQRFPEWSRIVAAPIAWCSGHDPVKARPPSTSSRDGEAARSLVVAWRSALGAEAVTVAALLSRVRPGATTPGANGPRHAASLVELGASLAELAGARDAASLTARSVGKHLSRVLGKGFVLRGGDVATLRAEENRDGIKVYSLDVRAPDPAVARPTAGQKGGGGAGFEGFSGFSVGPLEERMPERERESAPEVFDA